MQILDELCSAGTNSSCQEGLLHLGNICSEAKHMYSAPMIPHFGVDVSNCDFA